MIRRYDNSTSIKITIDKNRCLIWTLRYINSITSNNTQLRVN